MSHNEGLQSKFIAVLAAVFVAGFMVIPRRAPASPAEPVLARSISVVSLNLAKVSDPDTILRDLRRAPRLRHADLFLLQEVVHEESKPSVAEKAALRLGYFATFAAAGPGVHDQGLALMSRYPITDVRVRRLKSFDLGFRSRSRFSIAATVHTPWGNLRVWNVHLDTRVNAGERLEQLQPVIDDASRHSGAQLIGGDFNTNDVYWVRNIVPLPVGPSHSAAIRSAMRRHGFDTPLPSGLNTYPVLGRHLDWVFTRALRPLGTSVEPAAFSDHNAIWVRVSL